MRTLAIIAAGALGTWLGVHVIGAFLSTMIFNVAEDRPVVILARLP